MSLVGLLVTLLVLVLIGWLVFYLIDMLPIPAEPKQLVKVIVGVIFLIYLLGVLFGVGGWPVINLR